ncbi:hypothetical protein SBOR_7061 [Sclerotinia borealis F-4128]|uniref:Uncharacterized protein n=1 Tax=Sclerotinia borealis (strain F-4128) TaxID=1432307 RepID=W9CD93_SCLBF|nr:hypothetical protein SBOR_7061 [Sclerotinia borealis F-4128]
MTYPESQILKPPSRAHSRPSTPGASFLHTTSLNGPNKHSSNAAATTKTLTPDALPSSSPSPIRVRRLGETEPASRSKTSLTLSLPEEETFGQPSIDLPGLNMARDFGFGLRIGSRISRIEERRSVVVVEDVRQDGKEDFENVNLDAHRRWIEGRGKDLGLEKEKDDVEVLKERRIAEMLDRREDDEEDKDNVSRGLLGRIWGSVARKCCCC